MMGINPLIAFIGIVSTLSIASAFRMSIKPTLIFKSATTTFSVNSNTAIDNLGTYPALVDFIKTAKSVCAVGRWIFYPDVDWQYNGKTGMIIGVNENEKCVDISPMEITNFMTMKSYRHIGPPDLSVTSITLYSLPCFGGKDVYTYDDTTQPFKDIAMTQTAVGSYVVTAPTDTDPAVDQAEVQKTWIQLFKAADASTTIMPEKTCLALINPSLGDGTKVAKMHFQQALTPTDFFGSLQFTTYQPGIRGPMGECSVTLYNYITIPHSI